MCSFIPASLRWSFLLHSVLLYVFYYPLYSVLYDDDEVRLPIPKNFIFYQLILKGKMWSEWLFLFFEIEVREEDATASGSTLSIATLTQSSIDEHFQHHHQKQRLEDEEQVDYAKATKVHQSVHNNNRAIKLIYCNIFYAWISISIIKWTSSPDWNPLVWDSIHSLRPTMRKRKVNYYTRLRL